MAKRRRHARKAEKDTFSLEIHSPCLTLEFGKKAPGGLQLKTHPLQKHHPSEHHSLYTPALALTLRFSTEAISSSQLTHTAV
jgi:hypothetical protein